MQAQEALGESSVGSFAEFSISKGTLEVIAAQGWDAPTPIQEMALPALLRGEDVAGMAQTGSGKTAAFSIPLVERLQSGPRGIQAIVLAPTRELAAQAATELRKLMPRSAARPVVLCGGAPMGLQIKALKNRRTAVAVGTPGRVLDHLERGTLDLGGARYVVLDEADRMLDMGFAPDVERILSHAPGKRQTALFSATMPKAIRTIVDRHMRSPQWVEVKAETSTVETVEQVYYRINGRDKTRALRSLLDAEERPLAIVFRRTKRGADKLHQQLERAGYRSGLLHGGKTQSQRERTLAAFSRGKTRVLVATNVAARGLDIPDISHVINYDLPEDVETYVHRIGRTARAGKGGVAATLVGENEVREFNKIKGNLSAEVRKAQLPAA